MRIAVGGAPGYGTDRAAHIRRVFDLAREYDANALLACGVNCSLSTNSAQ